VAGEYWQDVAGLCNHNFGREALPRIGQSWTGGTCKLNADGAMIQGLRIPLVSSMHLALTCYVRAFSNAASSCSVTFREAGGATATVVIVTTSASGAWYSASLAMPAAGDYAQVSFEASSMAGVDRPYRRGGRLHAGERWKGRVGDVDAGAPSPADASGARTQG
jgi:hypothetical protein